MRPVVLPKMGYWLFLLPLAGRQRSNRLPRVADFLTRACSATVEYR